MTKEQPDSEVDRLYGEIKELLAQPEQEPINFDLERMILG
jgi:hypothetical protein